MRGHPSQLQSLGQLLRIISYPLDRSHTACLASILALVHNKPIVQPQGCSDTSVQLSTAQHVWSSSLACSRGMLHRGNRRRHAVLFPICRRCRCLVLFFQQRTTLYMASRPDEHMGSEPGRLLRLPRGLAHGGDLLRWRPSAGCVCTQHWQAEWPV